MFDDIGFMQPSIYHRSLMVGETPNIDRIGNEGAIFMDYLAMQSCTSGRNAFFTGMYPLRLRDNQQQQEARSRQVSAQDVHDGGVADTLNIVVIGLVEIALRQRHEPVHDQADHQHPRHVPRVIVAGHGVEEILEPVECHVSAAMPTRPESAQTGRTKTKAIATTRAGSRR